MSEEAPIIRVECSVKGQPLTKKTWKIAKKELILRMDGLHPVMKDLMLMVEDTNDKYNPQYLNLPDE